MWVVVVDVVVVKCIAKMEFLQLSSVLIVVLTAVSSVEAGVTPFEQPFLPAGIIVWFEAFI